MRIVFFGTPVVAIRSLEELIGSGHQVIAVVTAPDRPKGRGLELAPSPVNRYATDSGIAVLQPASLKDDAAAETLSALSADAFVVVAYGRILPPAILQIPPRGCLNVHYSLLPRLRGAAPVQWALIEGMTLTGVTVMQMDEGLDTGPIYAQLEEPILEEDDAGTLGARLADKGAELLVQVLDRIESDGVDPHLQAHLGVSLAPKIKSEHARIRWSDDVVTIRNKVRAFNPAPGAWTMTSSGMRLKVWRVEVSNDVSTEPPGTIDITTPDVLVVDTGGDRILLEELQPEGGRRMSPSEYIRGYRPRTGETFQ